MDMAPFPNSTTAAQLSCACCGTLCVRTIDREKEVRRPNAATHPVRIPAITNPCPQAQATPQGHSGMQGGWSIQAMLN